jgi:hypothetical protein
VLANLQFQDLPDTCEWFFMVPNCGLTRQMPLGAARPPSSTRTKVRLVWEYIELLVLFCKNAQNVIGGVAAPEGIEYGVGPRL